MSSLSTPSRILPTQTVGEIVAARPALASVFERVGIDFCCGGKSTLASACARGGLDLDALTVVLEAVPAREPGNAVDAAAMSLAGLADHIERTHHARLREELPVLVEQADRVAAKHTEHDPRLAEVAETVHALAGEMFSHMLKEEQILFPHVRELEQRGQRPAAGCTLAHAIHRMEHEHAEAGGALARLRALTDGFVPPADACTTHRVLLAGLAQLETDLHLHVHKENNILFPRALALEARLPA